MLTDLETELLDALKLIFSEIIEEDWEVKHSVLAYNAVTSAIRKAEKAKGIKS